MKRYYGAENEIGSDGTFTFYRVKVWIFLLLFIENIFHVCMHENIAYDVLINSNERRRKLEFIICKFHVFFQIQLFFQLFQINLLKGLRVFNKIMIFNQEYIFFQDSD